VIYLTRVVPVVTSRGAGFAPLIRPTWPVGWIDLRSPFDVDLGVLYAPGDRRRIDGLVPLADDYRGRLKPGMRRHLELTLGVDVPDLPLHQLLYVLLRHRAREGKRLEAGHYWYPHYRIYLGGAREDGTSDPILVRRARIPAFVDPTFTETWPTNDTLWDASGQDLAWTILAGNWDVTSGTLRNNTTGQGQIQVRCDEIAGSDAMEARCQMTISARGALIRQMGVFARHGNGTSPRSHYRIDFDRNTLDPDECELNRFDAAAPTLLALKNTDHGAGPHTVGIRCDGSTIFGYIGSSPYGPATDTTYIGSSNRQSGLDCNINSAAAVTDCQWGQFVFEDLAYHIANGLPTPGAEVEF
jgi:hypothetical protein